MDIIRESGKPAILPAPRGLTMQEAGAWLSSVRADVRAAVDADGAVLVRGLPIASPGDFGVLRDIVIGEPAEYRERATPRTSFGDAVYSSTEFPADQRILPHNENSYTLSFPGFLVFGCVVAADEGGATPVADCRKVLRHISPDLVERFRQHGWALARNYTDYFSLGWKTAFSTTEEAAVTDYCEANTIGATWRPNGSLRTVQRRSAIIRHPRLGDEVWFNHVAFWNVWSLAPEVRDYLLSEHPAADLPFNTFFGDGTELTAAEIAEISAAYEAATVRERWQSGDLMLVDNLLSAHGRDPYRGARTVLVAMGETVPLTDCSPTVTPTPAFSGPLTGDVR